MDSVLIRGVSPSSSIYELLTTHDDDQANGFITRLDRASIRHKRAAFYYALSLNSAIFFSLVVLAVLTIQSNLQAPYPPSLRLAFALTQDVLLISAVLVLLRSTLVPFFLGECRLRFRQGFRETEIVIRRAPPCLKLGKLIANNNGKGDKAERGVDSLWQTTLCLVNPQLLYYRPGALLSNDYWTLEYPTLLDAYERLERGEISENDFDFSVWKREDAHWTACELWRLQEIMTAEQESQMFENLFLTEKI